MRTATRLSSFALALLACAAAAFGQTSQGYLNDLGNTPYGVNIPVENGFINISNGNLHLEFPIASHPQRGALSLNERLVYDSRIWMFLPLPSSRSYHWWPKNVTPAGGTDSSGGWRFVKGNEIGSISYTNVSNTSSICNPDDNAQMTDEADQILWTDPGGTTHPLNATRNLYYDGCQNNSYVNINSGPATDGSGYSASDDGSGNPIIFDNSGNQVYPQVIDRYGNYLAGNGDLVDSTGRAPVLTTPNANGNPNVTWYDVLVQNGPINNQGLRARYIVTTAPVSVATNFQQSDVYEWNPTNPMLYPVQSIQLPDGSQYTFGYDSYGGLTSMTLPTGGTIYYGYGNFVDSSNTANRWLTSRTVGNNPAMTFTPSVVTGCSNYGSGCVEQVNLHKPSGDETVYQLTLVGGAWNTGVTAYTGAANGGQQLSSVATVDRHDSACSLGPVCSGQTYVSQSTSTTTLYGPSQTVSSQTQTVYNPSVGKVSAVKSWDYGTNFGGTPTRETDYTYTGVDVQQVTVLSNGNQAGQTNYGYTTTPAVTTSGVPLHGTQNAGGPYLQTVSHVLTGGNPSVTTYGMDDTGQVVSVRDPNGNPATTFTYQDNNSLPYQTKNGLGQVTQYGYDWNSGAITSVQDPNDLANNRSGTTYSYESGAGRLQSIHNPDGGQTSYSYPSATEVDTTVLATPSPSISSQDYLDSFGRKYQHVQAGVSSETTYDANGRVSCTTNPHTGSVAGTDGSTCVTAYDGLDRPLTQRQPDNTTLGWAYNGASVSSTDEAGKQWKRTSDAFGHLVTVVEPGNYTTSYTYDGLGNLQSTNQGGLAGTDAPRVRTFVHDSLGRLTNECHPEAVAGGQTCSSNGTWSMSYSYYPGGNVRTQTDARGVTATLGYDGLNRLTDKTYSDGTPGQHFRYDQTNIWMGPQYNTIGRLSQNYTDPDMRGSGAGCGAQSQDLTNANAVGGNPTRCQWTDELYSYDAMGRATVIGTASPSEAGRAAHGTYPTYDVAGQLIGLRYPDGRTINQTWDGASHLQKVAENDSYNGYNVNYTYASGFTYTPAGAQAEVTFGNGVYTHTPYNNRQQICQTWISGQQGYVDKHYMYGDSSQYCYNTPGNNGTISQILDMKNGNRSQGFSYDSLNRLASFSNGDATMQQSYSLDPFGNLSQSGTLSFQAGMNPKNQFPAGGFGYDQAGNTTTANLGFGQTNYQFDGVNRMFSVNNGADYYTYDAAGDRMRQDSSSGWTEYQYLNGQVIAEKASDGIWSNYIYANGQKIARADGFDQRIHLHGTQCSGCGWSYAAWNLPTGIGHVIQNGDKVSWRQSQGGTASGGYTIQFTDGTLTAWDAKDADGQATNNLSNSRQWWEWRTVDLSAYAGRTISGSWVVADGNTAPGDWDEYFGEIAITSVDGTVTPIFTRQTAMSLGYFGNPHMTNLSGGVEHNTRWDNYLYPYFNTTYYHGDQIGSARLTTAGGGWATTSDTFYPYGQEPGGTAGPNHYQYAGLERDPDTGLDHATFRQYSSTTGRWMSPDPYDGSMDLGNPQSLNRYNYAANNPLSFTDPSGEDAGRITSTVTFQGDVISSSSHSWDDGAAGLTLDVVSLGIKSLVDWVLFHPTFNGSAFSRPACVAAFTAAGASGGALAGGAVGEGTGVFFGGAGGTFAFPGVGTVGGGILGGQVGGYTGGAAGGFVGGNLGNAVGNVLCAKGNGPSFGGNKRENKQANEAKRDAEKEAGKKLTQNQESRFHDLVSHQGMDYWDMRKLAVQMLRGEI